MQHAEEGIRRAWEDVPDVSLPTMTAPAPGGAASPIVDNVRQRAGDFLRAEMAGGPALSFVSAYFTIYTYEALSEVLEGASRLRFLYGDPQGVGTVDP